MENSSWSDHITNEQVLMMVGEQRSLTDTTRVRQMNWIGHILRKLISENSRGREKLKLFSKNSNLCDYDT